ncbi:MAG: VCBS repeat-containing protein [Bacteroidetes bacterium]|nr:VCBS repeat-containing protein [Bacteroidota bacterium]
MKKLFTLTLCVLLFSYAGFAQQFTKVTGSVVTNVQETWGGTWADYDKDGDLDLYVNVFQASVNNPNGYNYLFRNDCNGNFTRITAIPGGLISEQGLGGPATWIDYDNDGDEDMFISRYGATNLLYRNNSDGTFTKITNLSFVADSGYTASHAFVDYDNDGDLDVYLANEDVSITYDPILANDFIYRNDGSGVYSLTANAVRDSVNTRLGVWGDYDNDGFMDLFITTATRNSAIGIARLFHNNGNGTFTHIYDIPSSEFSASWIDYDNDGDLDIFVRQAFGSPNHLYRNDGNGIFTDVPNAGGINSVVHNNGGVAWGDYDNDGDLDVFLSTVYFDKVLYKNNGDGTFSSDTTTVLTHDGGNIESYGVTWADYDNDGDLDLYVANAFGAPENFLYRNNGNSSHWIDIKCKGTTSNREAIGARIYVKATISGQPHWQMREINTNLSDQFGGLAPYNQHFGIGDATVIDSLTIVWPASHTTQIFTNVAPDRFIEITEGAGVNAIANAIQCNPIPGSSYANAIDLGRGDTTANNITMTDSVRWFKFVADSSVVRVTAKNTNGSFNSVSIYEGSYNNLNTIENVNLNNDTLVLETSGLMRGQNYYLRISSPQGSNINIGVENLLTVYEDFSLFICSDGTVKATGENLFGQLGDGTTINKTTPVQVSGLTDIVAVATGWNYSIALKNDGTVWAWGDNFFGALGDGTNIERHTPVQVHGTGNVGFLTGIIAISTGSDHCLALKSDGTVWAWGSNATGELGDGTITGRLTPVQVHGTGNVGFLTGIKAIAGGHRFSLAVNTTGKVWSWGWDVWGQLGDGGGADKYTPVSVSGLTSGVIGISAGYSHSLAVKSNGTVFSWGTNLWGQLGDGTNNDHNTPVSVTALSSITAVAAGNVQSIFLKNNGTVWTCGHNASGELGDFTLVNKSTPIQVHGFNNVGFLTNIVSIVGEKQHSLATKSDGTSWAWGINDIGQLGDGTTTNRNTPVQVNTGCTALTCVPPVVIASATSPICSVGQSSNLSATGYGGVPPYTYSWTPAFGLSCPTCSTTTASPNNTTNYFVTVTDAVICSSTVPVNVNPSPTANAGTDKYICPGTSVVIGGSPSASGGTAPYTFSWTPNNGTLSNAAIANPSANPNSTTTYNLLVTDANGCTGTDGVVVIVSSPTANAGTDKNTCPGSPVVIGGTPSASGGTAPYTFSWTSVPAGFNSNIANPTVSPNSTTTYNLLVTDAHGCTGTDIVVVIVNSLPTANAGTDKFLCAIHAVIIGGSPSSASGGTTPYTYAWTSVPAGFSSNVANPTVTPNSGVTTYNLLVTDANGCTSTDGVVVTVNPLPTAIFTSPANSLCITNPISPIQFTYSGTGAVSWSWDFGDRLSTLGQNTSSLQNPTHRYISPGSYLVTLTVTSSYGCAAVSTQIVNIASDCCALTVAYDDETVVPSILPSGTLITWAQPYKLNRTITVPKNSTLEIKAGVTIEFGPFGKIVVENGDANNQGGVLFMHQYSKFTSVPSCNVMWPGVEVRGVPSELNSSPQQGQIFMINSTIENAHIGVLLGQFVCSADWDICTPWVISNGGGIINADGANFNHNGTSIEALPYMKSNAGIVKNCTFIGGVLPDPGYKTGNTGYTYPSAVNPYYGPHTFFGDSPRLVYLWSVRDITFTDNIFRNANKGIQENNAKCKVLKGTGLGNQFLSISGEGLYAEYYNSSNILFGNTIDGSTFNTINTGIYISAGQGDKMTNNIFGAYLNQSVGQNINQGGIYMNNSSAYTILDNKFRRHLFAVFLNYSPTLKNTSASSIIANKTADGGNIFTQCGYAIFSLGDNTPVIIHCNTTSNKSSNASDYINNWSGKFGTQGALSTSDYTKPAGNQFDMPAPAIKRQTSTLAPFSYYAHRSPIQYKPIDTNIPNISSIACPSHLQCCPTSLYRIANPSSSYYLQQMSVLAQQISSLQTEFNTVSAALNKGQTAQLLAAIGPAGNVLLKVAASGNNDNENLCKNLPAPGDIKELLIKNSPLSDEVMIAFINRKCETPPGIFKDVMILNSPVTENTMPFLQEKLNSLPSGIATQIRAAQTDITNRTPGAIAQDIKAAETERSAYLVQLISFYTENDSAQKAIDLLEQEHTVAADQTLLATYIADSNLVAAQQKLSSMTAANPAEQAYLDLQGMLLNLSLQGKSVFAIDSAQEAMVRNIAAASYGLASSNACAILSLVFNEECQIQQLPASAFRMQAPSVIASEEKRSLVVYLGDNIPNPFNNTTIIPYTLPDEAEKAHINIYDVTGKLLRSYEVTTPFPSGRGGDGLLVISANDFEDGVYMYNLETNGMILGNKKMIIIKE